MAKAGDTSKARFRRPHTLPQDCTLDQRRTVATRRRHEGGGRVPIEHVHPYIEERFEILSGTARLSMRGQLRDVGAGQTVVVPAGTPHVWGTARG